MTNLISDRRTAQFIWTLASIGGVWIVSDFGYYFVLPPLGHEPSYNHSPIATTLHYVFWTGIVVIAFWPLYARWSRYAKWATFENRLTRIVFWSLAFAGSALSAAHVLPALSPFDLREGLTPPELPLAPPWYFLPKSIEILFQQLLIVALVLTLSAMNCMLRKISVFCTVLFGGAHILLAFVKYPGVTSEIPRRRLAQGHHPQAKIVDAGVQPVRVVVPGHDLPRQARIPPEEASMPLAVISSTLPPK